jgi:hypothetical protein
VQEVEALYGLRCITLLTLSELIEALEARTAATDDGPSGAPSAEQLAALRRYRLKYGVGTT